MLLLWRNDNDVAPWSNKWARLVDFECYFLIYYEYLLMGDIQARLGFPESVLNECLFIYLQFEYSFTMA